MVKNRINFLVLLIFAIFVNPIIIGGHEIICYLLVYGIPCLYILLNIGIIKKMFFRIPIFVLLIISWIILCLGLSVFFPILHNTYDFSYVDTVLAIIRKVIIYLFLYFVVYNNIDENPTEGFMIYYSYATALYVIGSIIFAIFPTIRTFWGEFLSLDTATNHLFTSYGYTVRFGWSGFSGFRSTIDCSLCVVFLTYLFGSKDSKYRLNTIEYLILTLMCFLGNMFYGRTGVIVSLICIVVGLFVYKKISLKFIFGTSLGIAFLFGIINVLKDKIVAINEWYIWLSTPFRNLFLTGSFNNYSADHLLNDMIFFPDIKTFMLGDGRYTDLSGMGYYMGTDSGFMRQILFWGIVITSIMYLMWLATIFASKRSNGLKLMLLILCIVFEIKGETYYQLMPLFLLFYCFDYLGKNEQINKTIYLNGIKVN